MLIIDKNNSGNDMQQVINKLQNMAAPAFLVVDESRKQPVS